MAEPDVTLFGLALPAFNAVDRLMGGYLGPLPRLLAWGCLMATLVMLLYKLISPQQKLSEIRLAAAYARRQIAAFDGEFSGLAPIVRDSLKLSLRQIAWIFFPAVIASLPLLNCIIWLDSAYGYRLPASAQSVHLNIEPMGERIDSSPPTALQRSSDGWSVAWPRIGAFVNLQDRHGSTLVVLSGTPANDVIEPRKWWNSILGNPMGYLPADSPVNRLAFNFVPAEVFDQGPHWIRRWEAPFFLSLIVLSILFKVVFHIE